MRTEKDAAELTVISPPMVIVSAVLPVNWSTARAPLPIVRLLQVPLAPIETVWPFETSTLSVAVGTPVGVHMAGLLQPPVWLDTLFCPKTELEPNS